jgi:hypothetical protein
VRHVGLSWPLARRSIEVRERVLVVLIGDPRRPPRGAGVRADIGEPALDERRVEQLPNDRAGARRGAAVMLTADHRAQMSFEPVDHGCAASLTA